MRMTLPLFLAAALIGASSAVHAATVSLDSWSAGDSTYYEYGSDGFVRMDLYSPDFPTHQSFHAINDPEVIYNQAYDGFPNEEFMRFGAVEYDDSSLVGGTGTGPITGLTLGIATDPFDPGYVNFVRFATNTIVDPNSVSGTVDVVSGKVVGMNLSADIVLNLPSVLLSTQEGNYPGTFTVTGTTFEVNVHGTQNLDTIFGQQDVELEWDFQGQTLITADFDGDQDVDGDDFLSWQRGFGTTSATLADGDANVDTVVNGKDLIVWEAQYGASAAPLIAAAAVPEPESCVLLLPALAVVLGSLHRSRHSRRQGVAMP